MIDINLLLSWGAAHRKVSAEETLFNEGQSGFFYYQLASVRWANIDDAGKECIHSIVEPGESFGDYSLLKHVSLDCCNYFIYRHQYYVHKPLK